MEVIEPNLGVFGIEPVGNHEGNYCLTLALDFYQSNCYRQWLDLRWQVSSLVESTIALIEGKQLMIMKEVSLAKGESPEACLKDWHKAVLGHFKIYLSSRR